MAAPIDLAAEPNLGPIGETMEKVRTASFHEAGHAVVAYHSRFFVQSGMILVSDRGEGVINVSICKKKFWRDYEYSKNIPDLIARIAKDQAVVLCAGFAGQMVAQNKGFTVGAGMGSSRSDHELAERALVAAGLKSDLEPYRATARSIILREWWAVEDIALFIQTEKRAHARTVSEMIDEMYWRGSMA